MEGRARPPALPVFLGAALWLLVWPLVDPSHMHALVLLGPLVAVPLALLLVADAPREHMLLRVAPLAAAPLAVSLLYEPGAGAGLWTLPWLVWTLVAALWGLLRLAEDGLRSASGLAIGAGHLFLAVGGAWLTISRWGLVVAGFEEPVPILTAAHFHFAGFVLPVLAGLVARRRAAGAPACLLVVAGMPVIAAGIVLAPRGVWWVEPLGVAVLGGGALWLAALHVRLTFQHERVSWVSRTLWLLSALSLGIGIALALTYGVGRHFDLPHPSIEEMVATHAVLNAVGFSVGALIAWQVAGPPPRARHLALRLPGEPLPMPDPKALSNGEGVTHDRYDVVVHEVPGPGNADATFDRVRDHIRRFDIFPPHVLACRDGPIAHGKTLVCAHRFGPLRLVFQARVRAIIDGPGRYGFVYETLEGHPERGRERFLVEKQSDGKVHFLIEAWSSPDHPLVRIQKRIARRRQIAAARSALERMQQVAAGT